MTNFTIIIFLIILATIIISILTSKYLDYVDAKAQRKYEHFILMTEYIERHKINNDRK